MPGLLFAFNKHRYRYPFLLVLLGLVAFSSVLWKGFILDDKSQIVTNTAIHSITSIPSFFTKSMHFGDTVTTLTGFTYRPITYVIHTLLYVLGNGTPFIFHLFLLLLYLANVVLVYIIFSKFARPTFAFATALIFLIHPVNQEVVTYISVIQDALCFFFGISALLVIRGKLSHTRQLIFSCILLLLAVLSKETGILFIFAALVYLFFIRRELLTKYLFALGIILFVYFSLRMTAGMTPFLTIIVPQSPTMLLLVPKMLLYYISAIIMPLPALPLTFLNSTSVVSTMLSFSIISCVYTGMIWLGFLLKRTQPIRVYGGYMFFLGLFLLSTFFHSQIIPLDVLVSKRWIYVQLFAFLGMLCLVLETYYRNITAYKRWFIILYWVYFTILLIETLIALLYY